MISKPTICCILLLSVITIGCKRGPTYTLAPVSGQVKLNGKPLDGAEVRFMGAGMTGVGTTDAEGRYSLPRGAVVGNNRVSVSKFTGGSLPAGIDPNDTEQIRLLTQNKGGSGPKQAVAPKFSDPGRSELKFDVPAGGSTSADFEVTGP